MSDLFESIKRGLEEAVAHQRGDKAGGPKKIGQVKKELLADEEFLREYDALEKEFSTCRQLIEAGAKANGGKKKQD